ncbi:ArsR/SmtB family transcription factor [Brevibacterium antiquum]|uniref:ArsR/SmtB family transcription factor n=1 Tax=Brevibacterium antiquum TaxID=234835 RepID=UPI0018DFCEAB
MTDADDLDKAFKALADPTRRRLLDELRRENGQSLRDLCEGVSMARQSLTQHIDQLVDANLIVVIRKGRERRHYLNPHPIHEIERRWTRDFDQQHLDVIDAVKKRAEETAMTTTSEFPDYVYVTYIRATREDVWDALTNADITPIYWSGIANVSDWQAGSEWTHRKNGDPLGDYDIWGRILESRPPERLVFTFQPAAQPLETKGSIVTYDIKQTGEVVKLTVSHTNLPDKGMLNGISQGWPAILASLKSYLESGEPLPYDTP